MMSGFFPTTEYTGNPEDTGRETTAMAATNLSVVSIACVLMATLSGCGFFRRGPAEFPGGVQEGIASWYGPGFHGKRTASGTVYNQNEMTAAHQTLPLGTQVVVINLRNGRQVEVEITDRGPFVDDRVIDLSYAAARELDMIGTGTAPVRIEPASDQPLANARYAVQVGAFRDRDAAEELQDELAEELDDVHISKVSTATGTYHRVRIGPFAEREDAQQIANDVAAKGWQAIVVEESAAQ